MIALFLTTAVKRIKSRWDLFLIALGGVLLFRLTLRVMAQTTNAPAASLMFDPTVIAAAIVTVLTALGVLVVTIINAKAASDDRRDARASRVRLDQVTTATSGKVDVVIETAKEIHGSTNANLSKVTASLDVALARIEGLQGLVASMVAAKKVADTLAVLPAPGPEPAPGLEAHTTGVVKKVLDSIDMNTKAIDENTKKTSQDVKDLQDVNDLKKET